MSGNAVSNSLAVQSEYILKATDFRTVGGINLVDIYVKQKGLWVMVKSGAKVNDNIFIGSVGFMVKSIDRINRIVTFGADWNTYLLSQQLKFNATAENYFVAGYSSH